MSESFNELSPKELVESFKSRAKKDNDVVVAITGEEGSSKSTLATQCVVESLIYEGHTREEVLAKIPEFTIFSPNKERIRKQITEAPRYGLINADEAIKILYKLNWNSDIQKFLNMFYALCRKENKISVLCMPRYTDFNEFFRKHRIKFWIHVLDRGVGVLFGKDWNPFTDDPWWMKEGMITVKGNYGRKKVADFNVDEKIRILSKVRNFIAVVRYEDLDPEVKKVYKKGKEDFGYDDMEEENKTGQIGAGKMAEKHAERIKRAVLHFHKTMSATEIGKLLEMPVPTVSAYIREEKELPLLLEVPSIKNNQSKRENLD
jgi:hypothetical protein